MTMKSIASSGKTIPAGRSLSRRGLLAKLSLALLAGIVFFAPRAARADDGGTSICGYVYNDVNGDGILQVNETTMGVPGSTISLNDSSGNPILDSAGHPVVEMSGPDGSYCFGGLTTGTYIVKLISMPSGYFATNALPGLEYSGFTQVGTGAVGVTLSTTAIKVPATTAFDDYEPNNFLITMQPPPPPPVLPVSICGVVYRDSNGDGALQAGEPALPGVQMQLLNASGVLIATLSTDSSGSYCFMNLPVGNYTVQEIVPTGFSADNALPGLGGTKGSPVTISVAAITPGTAYQQENFLLRVPNNSGAYTTFTQGGYGSKPHGNNPGALLQKNFAFLYPNGLTVGTGHALFFGSAADVSNFLPQGGTPGMLTHSYRNPTARTEAGVFAGQVVALQLSVDLSNAGVTRSGLTGLKVVSGPLSGYTVAQVLALANSVLGGSTNALPTGLSVSALNDVVTAINENFDGGTANQGYLR